MKFPFLLTSKVSWTSIVSKMLTLIWRQLFRALQSLQGQRIRDRVYLIAPTITGEDLAEVVSRAEFYMPSNPAPKLENISRLGARIVVSSAPLLFFGPKGRFADWLINVRPGAFDVDFRTNPVDGWAWAGLAEFLDTEVVDFPAVHARLNARIALLKRDLRNRCYVFGTGPSLSLANHRVWMDGYRIVCNTIVRDPLLWRHLEPDFIVAGDAIYHFGHTSFARAFRRDLRARLEESEALFVFPAKFYPMVLRELTGLKERLVPIPTGWHTDITRDLTRSFRLPGLGNVLGLLLLPLACTLSKQVCLWGFDGRAPQDALFWKNSDAHTYAEHLDELTRTHPRFFEHYVPKADPNRYVRAYQGEGLDKVLEYAEEKGWTFEMLHPTWTPALQKRYRGDASPGIT